MMSQTMTFALCLMTIATHAASLTPATTEADQAFKERRVAERARHALTLYRQEMQRDPESIEIAWRLAMACQFVGYRLETDSERKLSLFREGKDAARWASRKKPDCVACHFWAAINMALLGDTAGPFRTLFLLKDILEHLERAAALDPSYAYGGPHRILGLVFQKLPGILGGSVSRAREELAKAIHAAPTSPLNYLFMAKLLKEELEDAPNAANLVAQARELPPPAIDDIESWEAWEELGRL